MNRCTRMNGRELLAEIKSDIMLRHIPVVMLTTSQSETDATFCYEHGAILVLTKHVDFDAFLGVVRELKHIWDTFSAANVDWLWMRQRLGNDDQRGR
ncbi:hypothetical protein MCP1_760001 [Candidatus Terasakiella magnetica]|nr:hypothetical protein MCP1_760001 [Candidatus Terasakiella magnetica]